LITPRESADELAIECWFKLAHHDVRTAPGLPLAAHAQKWPFDYSDEERRDLGATLDLLLSRSRAIRDWRRR
jgi:hypothetical protein